MSQPLDSSHVGINFSVQTHFILEKTLVGGVINEFLCTQPPSTVFMEACYSAHHWGRIAERCDHQVMLIPAQHVSPFTRGNKTDANDAVAIVEASQRPNLRFVSVKTLEQQDIQSLHRIRDRLVRNRTGLMNQTRGLLAEYGIVFAQGKKALLLGVEQALNDAHLNDLLKLQLRDALDELYALNQRTKEIERTLKHYVEQSASAQILHSIPGIGFLNASALAAKYNDPAIFKDSRSLAVHLGLTPRLSASGNRQVMHGISKRGDAYIRKQLIHGARALLAQAKKWPDDPMCRWALRIKQRRGHNIAAVALANRMARLIWVLLSKQEHYKIQMSS